MDRPPDQLPILWCSAHARQEPAHEYCGIDLDITEAMIRTAERQARRLRSWFETKREPRGYGPFGES